MEFAIALLLIIAIVSGIGTFLDLGSEADESAYIRTFGPVVMKVAETFDLHAGKMYGTKWFNTLLALLVANSLLCGINWLPKTMNSIKSSEPIKNKNEILSMTPSVTLDASKTSFDNFSQTLNEKGFEIRTLEENGVKMLVAEKHRYSHWAFFITHIGFIIIIIGAVMGRLWSEKGSIIIEEGAMNDTVHLRNGSEKKLPFALALDDFKMEYYSDLEISSPGINESERKTVDIGSELSSPDGKYSIHVDAIYPDAVFENDKIVERSKDFISPIMQVSIIENGIAKEKVFLFPDEKPITTSSGISLRYLIDPNNPPKDWISEIVVISGNQPVGRKTVRVNHPLDFAGWPFYQSSYDQEGFRYTVLEAAKDPGVPVVYTGFIVLLIGVSFIFFFSHRKVWALVKNENGKKILVASSWTYHAHRDARNWFMTLVKESELKMAGGKE